VVGVLTVGSLFTGIGGLDLGLERAGMRILWQCEIDPYCRAVLRKILRNDTYGHYTCWMDEDGFHVWQHHICVGLPEESLLPRGTYKFWTEQEGRVVPSINCERCGLHENQIPVYKKG